MRLILALWAVTCHHGTLTRFPHTNSVSEVHHEIFWSDFVMGSKDEMNVC